MPFKRTPACQIFLSQGQLRTWKLHDFLQHFPSHTTSTNGKQHHADVHAMLKAETKCPRKGHERTAKRLLRTLQLQNNHHRPGNSDKKGATEATGTRDDGEGMEEEAEGEEECLPPRYSDDHNRPRQPADKIGSPSKDKNKKSSKPASRSSNINNRRQQATMGPSSSDDIISPVPSFTAFDEMSSSDEDLPSTLVLSSSPDYMADLPPPPPEGNRSRLGDDDIISPIPSFTAFDEMSSSDEDLPSTLVLSSSPDHVVNFPPPVLDKEGTSSQQKGAGAEAGDGSIPVNNNEFESRNPMSGAVNAASRSEVDKGLPQELPPIDAPASNPAGTGYNTAPAPRLSANMSEVERDPENNIDHRHPTNMQDTANVDNSATKQPASPSSPPNTNPANNSLMHPDNDHDLLESSTSSLSPPPTLQLLPPPPPTNSNSTAPMSVQLCRARLPFILDGATLHFDLWLIPRAQPPLTLIEEHSFHHRLGEIISSHTHSADHTHTHPRSVVPSLYLCSARGRIAITPGEIFYECRKQLGELLDSRYGVGQLPAEEVLFKPKFRGGEGFTL